ncbi:MAG: hypothetical protein E7165_00590 [Firmicutes bacterium]|nr:hypothetical protein [Bacillota bacterium]
MKKNNQKGFMLVEAFVVSTIVLGVLVFMFIQIRTIVNGFNKSFSYNTIPGIYIANELKKIIKIQDYDELKQQVELTGYVLVDEDRADWNNMFGMNNIKTLIIAKDDINSLKKIKGEKISDKVVDYINTITSSDVQNAYRIIVEFNDDTYASIRL